MKAEIIRVEVGMEGTFGVVTLDGRAFCVDMEPPDRGNAQNVSCIPAGTYTCKRVKSPLIERITGGKWKETFMIMNVLGRTSVLFHSGTFVENTRGCVLLASSFAKLQGRRAIINNPNTGKTFDDFMTIMRNVDEFELTVREIDLTPERLTA